MVKINYIINGKSVWLPCVFITSEKSTCGFLQFSLVIMEEKLVWVYEEIDNNDFLVYSRIMGNECLNREYPHIAKQAARCLFAV